MTYARRVEATHTKTEDAPRHEKRRQYAQRPKENEPPACVYIRPPAYRQKPRRDTDIRAGCVEAMPYAKNERRPKGATRTR